MGVIDVASLPIWGLLLAFAAGAAGVWFAGTRVSGYVDEIADRTGLGDAFVGMVLLGGITSLPEIATTLTASTSGNAPLAVNNIMGGIAMQVAILAVADATVKRHALTRVGGSTEVLLQGVLLVLVLLVVAIGIGVGDRAVLGVGAWTTGVIVLAIAGTYAVSRHDAQPLWQEESEDGEKEREGEGGESSAGIQGRGSASEHSLARLIASTLAASVAILVSGVVVTLSAEALADQTGLGSSFAGAVLLAISTSLPEVSTTLEAVRLKNYQLAFSNIFGTNLFDAGILFLADLTYGGPPVLNEVGTFAQVGALLGAALTVVYLAGIIGHQDRTVFRVGVSSALVLVLYLGGLVLLYTIR